MVVIYRLTVTEAVNYILSKNDLETSNNVPLWPNGAQTKLDQSNSNLTI